MPKAFAALPQQKSACAWLWAAIRSRCYVSSKRWNREAGISGVHAGVSTLSCCCCLHGVSLQALPLVLYAFLVVASLGCEVLQFRECSWRWGSRFPHHKVLGLRTKQRHPVGNDGDHRGLTNRYGYGCRSRYKHSCRCRCKYIVDCRYIEHKTLEYGCRVIYAGCPSIFGFGMRGQDGHMRTVWVLLFDRNNSWQTCFPVCTQMLCSRTCINVIQ